MENSNENYSEEQLNYVSQIKDGELRNHLLHQLRLRDNISKERDYLAKEYSELKNLLNKIDTLSPNDKAKSIIDKFYCLFPLEHEVITKEGDLSWEYNHWKQSKKATEILIKEILGTQLSESSRKYWEQVKEEFNNAS